MMTLAERHVAALNRDYLNRLEQALVQHAVFVAFDDEQTTQQRQMAATALAAPAHHAARMGYWILGLGSMAALESVDDLDDEDLLEAVQQVWTTYFRATGFTMASGTA